MPGGASRRSPDRPAAVGPSPIPALRTSLTARLAELERERAGIRAALKALDDRPRPRPRRRLQPEEHRAAVLAAVAADPGVRASMLALTLGRPVDDVRADLEALERDGRVGRDGLGWRTAG